MLLHGAISSSILTKKIIIKLEFFFDVVFAYFLACLFVFWGGKHSLEEKD